MSSAHSAPTGHAQAEPSGNFRAHPSANGELANGMYTAELASDNIALGRVKFEIIK